MRDLWQDFRYGARRLARTPGFTAAAVLTLALGIGATSSIFTLVRAVLLDALPYPDPERLGLVRGLMTRDAPEDWPISWLDLQDLGAEQKVFAGLAAVGDDLAYNLGSQGEPEHVVGEMVGDGYFELLGLQPAAGRHLRPGGAPRPGGAGAAAGRTSRGEGRRRRGGARVVRLGHDLWRRRFGGDPGVVGQVVRLNEEPYTVVGVLPAGFRGLGDEGEISAGGGG